MKKIIFILFFVLSIGSLFANDFDLVKKGTPNNNTLLIIGGIHGDEPGAFVAPSILLTHYKIQKGSLWVVPNLNFYSIIKRLRGARGDMNRKFEKISKNDPDYKIVEDIKKVINQSQVKLIVNLHDGSGFYRKIYIDSLHSPFRWGQSSIIDQSTTDTKKYGNLEEISQEVCKYVNKKLGNKATSYATRNTKTKTSDEHMQKSLTFYAINHGKAAFADEASKSLGVASRAYFHLLALEKYMDIMGIKYKRDFKLSPKNIKKIIDTDVFIKLYNGRIILPLANIRNNIKYFPIKKNKLISFKGNNYLLDIVKKRGLYELHDGNSLLSRLHPEYLEFAKINPELDKIFFDIDGLKKEVHFGDTVKVKKTFYIYKNKNYRANIIGLVRGSNEEGIKVNLKDLLKRYSIDKNAKIFRVEFYKKNKFLGMILVDFSKKTFSLPLDRTFKGEVKYTK